LTNFAKTFILNIAKTFLQTKKWFDYMVTIKDIAKEAGVSYSTVSCVLNGKAKQVRISDRAAEKVQIATKKLGYQRNEIAAMTRSGVNKTIALISNIHSTQLMTTFSFLSSGVLSAAAGHGFGVKIYSHLDLEKCYRDILGHGIKYLLVATVDKRVRENVAEFCRKYKLKMVYIFETTDNEFPVITAADYNAFYAATQHLLENGCKRIGLICAKHVYHYMKIRHQAYIDALMKFDIEVDDSLISCQSVEKDAIRDIEKMIMYPEGKRPDAFLCIGDDYAIAAISLAHKHHLKVPEDIQIIGAGNVSSGCYILPTLSTIKQDWEAVGSLALKILLNKKHTCKCNNKGEYLVSCQFIKRNSSM
jgi:LacI family transcriptional regulator